MVYEKLVLGDTREGICRRRAGRKGNAMAQRQRRNPRGVVLIWTAIVLFVMLGLVGLGIDWGKLALNVGQMQNGGDAAALAGAQIVKFDPAGAILRARDYGWENYAEKQQISLSTDDGVDIVLGRWIRQNLEFFPTMDTPDAVQVRVRRQDGLGGDRPPLGLVFGPIFNVPTIGTWRETIAWCFDSSGAALICLSTTADPGLKIWGNAHVDVDNGGIHVNSGVSSATEVGGSALIDCGQMNVVGGTDPIAGEGTWDKYMENPFSVNTGESNPPVEVIDDPVAANMGGINQLTVPTSQYGTVKTTVKNADGTTTVVETTADKIAINQSGGTYELGPGYYPSGISMTGNATVTLNPNLGWDSATMGQAIFYLGGVGLELNNGTLTGHGVTIYITEDATPGLDMEGNPTIDITSPGDADPSLGVDGKPGIAIWVDPDNPNELTVNGCSGNGFQGTMYFPGSHVDWEGTPGEGAPQVICGSMDVTGDLNVGVTYDQRNAGLRLYRSFIVR